MLSQTTPQNPNPENPFTLQTVAEEWSRSVEGEQGLWRDQTLYPTLQKWLDAFKQENPVILDIGSGQGRTAAELIGYKKYIGVEPSTFLTNRAKELYSSEKRAFITGNAYELPFPNESFDGIISVNVWFHLADIDQASKELSRVLKTGGSFFINTADSDSTEIWESFYLNPIKDGTKIQGEMKVPINNLSLSTFFFHTNQTVLTTLEKHGLKITSLTKSAGAKGRTLFLSIEGVKI